MLKDLMKDVKVHSAAQKDTQILSAATTQTHI